MESVQEQINEVTRMLIKMRDVPIDDTMSKILYGMQGDIKVIVSKLEEHTKSLEEIKTQTTAHNGRMRKLEMWRSMVVGALFIIMTFGGFMYFLLMENIDTKIQKGVRVAIDDYNLSISK